MMELLIPAMSCGHCVQAVTRAVQTVDPAARVDIDLASHRVQIETTAAREAVLAELAEAGYTPAA